MIQLVPGVGPPVGLPRVIAHFKYVVARRYIWPPHCRTAAHEKHHVIYVLVHNPLVAVARELHEPPKAILRSYTAQVHKVAHYHQSLDVVQVARRESLADTIVDGGHARCTVVPRGAQAPSIAEIVFAAEVVINIAIPLILPPKQLANEPLQAIEWHLAPVFENFGDDVRGIQQTNIERRGKHRVE